MLRIIQKECRKVGLWANCPNKCCWQDVVSKQACCECLSLCKQFCNYWLSGNKRRKAMQMMDCMVGHYMFVIVNNYKNNIIKSWRIYHLNLAGRVTNLLMYAGIKTFLKFFTILLLNFFLIIVIIRVNPVLIGIIMFCGIFTKLVEIFNIFFLLKKKLRKNIFWKIKFKWKKKLMKKKIWKKKINKRIIIFFKNIFLFILIFF